MTRLVAMLILTLGAFCVCASAHAQELSGPCPVGKKVADRQGNVGTVIDTDPVGCHVQMQDGTKKYYLSWMLHLADKPLVDPKEVAAIKTGRYSCYAGNPIRYVGMQIN